MKRWLADGTPSFILPRAARGRMKEGELA